MSKRPLPDFAYQDRFRKAVRAGNGNLMFAEVYTETSEIVFKYDTRCVDLIVREKFKESRDLWRRFLDLKPSDITDTLLAEMKARLEPSKDPA